MATQQSFLAPDNSSFANFKLWAKTISDFLATIGWVQQNDTGQVVWTATVLTLTQVAVGGGSAVYSYSSFTGPTPRVGMSVIFSGFGTGGNNVTATLTAVSGGASGTVTVVTSTQANETHAGSGTTTALAAVPSSNYVYEIWTPGDALQTGASQYFYKIEYGFSTTIIRIRSTISTSTNGAGTASGTVLGPYVLNDTRTAGVDGTTTTTTSECLLSGDTGRLDLCMFRSTVGFCMVLGIERTLDGSGNPTATGVTYIQNCGNSASTFSVTEHQTIQFGVGLGPSTPSASVTNNPGPQVLMLVGLSQSASTSSGVNNGNIAFSPVFPSFSGLPSYPHTLMLSTYHADFSEGQLCTFTLYGIAHTYVCLRTNGGSKGFGPYTGQDGAYCLMLRYD